MQITKRVKLKLSDLLKHFKREAPKDVYEMYALGETFDLYREPSDSLLEKDMSCYIDDSTTANDDNEDISPEFVVSNNLEFFYSGERFVDVILNVFNKIQDPSIDNLVDALNFYDKNDTFLDVD